MIADLKPYPAMKASGVPWLGEVPEHWEASKVKNLARPGYKTFIDGDWIESPYITDEGIRLIQTGNIGVGAYREKGFRYVSESTLNAFGCTEFQPREVLICRLGEPVGRACLAPNLGVRMITSVDVCILKPREDVLSAFVVYAMSSSRYLDWVNSLVRGSTRDRVSRSMLGSFVVPLPPVSEQAAIVRYLDYMDRRIRRYIRSKQNLIKLLEEQKQAIIHRAVTRGLDPDVRLKPSGVEWLGDVPEHWEVRKLGQISKVFNGSTPSRMQPAYWLGGTIAWLSSGKVNDYVVETPSELVTERALRDCSISLVPRGSVILGLIGQGKTRGMSALLAIDACINQNLAAIVPRHALDGRFLHHLLTAFYKPIREIGRGGNQEALNREIVARLRLPIPPIEEQITLTKYLATAVASLVCMRERLEQGIALLREYRTRLIADVVTGKLDVREAAALLPDEVGEPEPLAQADALTEAEEETEVVEELEE